MEVELGLRLINSGVLRVVVALLRKFRHHRVIAEHVTGAAPHMQQLAAWWLTLSCCCVVAELTRRLCAMGGDFARAVEESGVPAETLRVLHDPPSFAAAGSAAAVLSLVSSSDAVMQQRQVSAQSLPILHSLMKSGVTFAQSRYVLRRARS